MGVSKIEQMALGRRSVEPLLSLKVSSVFWRNAAEQRYFSFLMETTGMAFGTIAVRIRPV